MDEQIKPAVWTNTQESIGVGYVPEALSLVVMKISNEVEDLHPASLSPIPSRGNSECLLMFPVWSRRNGRSVTKETARNEKDARSQPDGALRLVAQGKPSHLSLPQFIPPANGQVWWDGVGEICHKPVISQGSVRVGSSSQPPPQKNWLFEVKYHVLIHRHNGTAPLALLGHRRELIQAKRLE